MADVTISIEALKRSTPDMDYIKNLSPCGKYMVWFHDGVNGTNRHCNPIGNFSAVMQCVSLSGEKFSIGVKEKP